MSKCGCAQMAGDRAFHRILPPDFRPLWVALGDEVPCPSEYSQTARKFHAPVRRSCSAGTTT